MNDNGSTKTNNMWTIFWAKIELCRNGNMILTISCVVDNFYTQALEYVDNIRQFVEIQGIFCYDRYVFVVDEQLFHTILLTACG
ncbi:hypothetical protein PAT3040_01470 [Paenibacillus agaridevorans]|uniref:Uncharacterized protein n=1 Tax=Paenibacillus agaridevorans TaxID=171404 RepID=A0A2R5EPK6_9BACL|nr:hypothetical protein PAT3040_01470 [Paenibacillus agaridevorans]